MKPFKLDVWPRPADDAFDYFVGYDVAWWNPHYFRAAVLDGELEMLNIVASTQP